MHDIQSKKDIIYFVDLFYNSVREDDLIGPIFAKKIGNGDWSKHLTKMHSFWNTVLFGEADYRGNPFSHHINLNIHKEHFDRWIFLFEKAIKESFQGNKADEAMMRANRMKLLFQSKLEYIRSNPNIKPIM